MNKVAILDKTFIPFIGKSEIDECIACLAKQINRDYKDKSPLFIAVLNGAFIFAADLFKQVHLNSRISFVKMVSYQGCETTNEVFELIGLSEDLENEDIIIIEDVVDTGNTIEKLLKMLEKKNPSSVKICTFLFKPDKYKKIWTIDYVGKAIPNNFVVGYGFDYNGYGRNLPFIYRLED